MEQSAETLIKWAGWGGRIFSESEKKKEREIDRYLYFMHTFLITLKKKEYIGRILLLFTSLPLEVT